MICESAEEAHAFLAIQESVSTKKHLSEIIYSPYLEGGR